MKVFRTKNSEIWLGNCLKGMNRIPEKSIHTCVTSPPYLGLRDYQTGTWEGGDDPSCDHVQKKGQTSKDSSSLRGGKLYEGEKLLEITTQYKGVCKKCGALRVDEQIGMEATVEEYVSVMVEVARGVRRLLRDDGTFWINIGDSYGSGPGRNDVDRKFVYSGQVGVESCSTVANNSQPRPAVKEKGLLGVPWLVAFALKKDGWILRQDIIWSKPNPMPESVTNRCTKSHEYIFLFAKKQKYFYDHEAIKDRCPDAKPWTKRNDQKMVKAGQADNRVGFSKIEAGRVFDSANKRSVWTVVTTPYPGSHFAVFPPELITPCILAGTSEKGCCPKCGAPWKRVLDKVRKATRPGLDSKVQSVKILHRLETGMNSTKSTLKSFIGNRDPGRHVTSSKTLGWKPSCECGQTTTVPCRVFDPFQGSGTTAQVAIKYGRFAVGTELSEEYFQFIKKRIQKAEKEKGFVLR